MLKREKSKQVVKLIFSFILLLLVLLIGLELLLRLSYPLYSNFNTEMWRYSKDIKTLSDIPNVPHLHMPNKKSQLYGITIETNSLGFRDYEMNITKAPNVTRILVLGDSVTLGWGVPLADTYSKVLERMLNQKTRKKYEVINMAVGNYNIENEVGLLAHYAYLQPDIVVLGFFPNDAEKTTYLKSDFIYKLKKSLYIYPFFWDKYQKIKYLFAVKKDGSYTSIVHQYYTEEYGGKERLKNYFAELNNLSKEDNFRVYVVLIPQFYNEFKDYDLGNVNTYVEDLCNSNNFTCIGTFNDFENYNLKDIIISPEDAHPNKLGHKIIADNIYKEVSANGKDY